MNQSTLSLPTKDSGPVECLGQKFSSDAARREHYLKLLAQKLKDPEFRKIEGFPIGKDEDILALSDPPYYTACPNPWLGDFIKHYGTPFDPKQPYHRQPMAADVSEGKNHPIYKAHSYHTKVPHRAIMRYLLHYTRPGDLVFDGFCGTGMTGVAGQLCGDRAEVQELGYRVKDDGIILDTEGQHSSKLGVRHVILKELSPAATFIAYNYNTPSDPTIFEQVAKAALATAEAECGWMFKTLLNPSKTDLVLIADALKRCTRWEECRDLLENEDVLRSRIGRRSSNLRLETLNYVVWSDVFMCPECGGEIVFWDRAVSPKDWQVRNKFTCNHCDASLEKDQLHPAMTKLYDHDLATTVSQIKIQPVLIHFRHGTKAPDSFDLALTEKIMEFPSMNRVPADRMIDGDEGRRNDPIGLTHVHHFYSRRNLQMLAAFAHHLGDSRRFVNVTSVGTIATRMYRFRSQNGSLGAGGGPLSGTLYVPSLCKEIPVLKMLREHIKKTGEVKRMLARFPANITDTSSSSRLRDLPSNSIDYIFVDPPFGGNLMYAELNFIWEAWLKVVTAREQEAITEKSQQKTLLNYQYLLLQCFREFYRVLKPGRWMTVEFSNSQASVWNAIQSTLQEAGFVVANVAALDKKQGSFKAVTTTTAVKQDLVISAYKPNGGLEERFSKQGETEEGVWDFTRTHLNNLPGVKPKGGQLEFIAERDPRILYDRMVAFYVGHSTPVPLSSAEFQVGLAEKFPERDGMYFLPEQVNDYDQKRAQTQNVGQLAIFVEDERSAVNWLRSFLKDRPSTTQDLYVDFMQQLGASWKKWEVRPELSALLDQNFLRYDGQSEVPSQIHSYLSSQFKDLRNLPKDHPQLRAKAKNRWYVPDPKKNVDVEMVRSKKLLEEFRNYLPDGYTQAALTDRGQILPGLTVSRPKISKGKKLKEIRTEAVRVGFKHCYQQKDYQTILLVAEMLPESVLNEDDQLQMIYDTAVTRSGTGD